MPKISVIVPIYKVEQYLRRCVESILNQTFQDFELILVDDGSPDNCGNMCDEYKREDPRIHVIHKQNGGLSDARNAGIDWVFANSDSEWITFIDSDDWVHERYLEILYRAVKETRCAVSVCSYEKTLGAAVWVHDENLKATIWNTEEFYVKERINATVAWGKLYHRDCFKVLRYPIGKLREDEFLTYRVLFAEKQIAVVSEPLYFYFQNPNGIMSLYSETIMSFFDALEEQIKYFVDNGYLMAARMIIRDYYIYPVLLEIELLEKKNSPDNKMISAYKERRKKFPKYLKVLDITDSGDQWLLMKVQPIRTRVKIYISAVRTKLINHSK